MKNKENPKNDFDSKEKVKFILMYIIYATIAVGILYHVLYFINTTITRKDYLTFLEYNFFVITDTSMEPDLKKNDLVIVKNLNEEQIFEGDIIAYCVNGNFRINRVTNKNAEDGITKYNTKFNANLHLDVETITNKNIIGKVTKRIPFLGLIINFLQTKFMTIFVFLFLIIKFLYNKTIYQRKQARKRKLIRKNNEKMEE